MESEKHENQTGNTVYSILYDCESFTESKYDAKTISTVKPTT